MKTGVMMQWMKFRIAEVNKEKSPRQAETWGWRGDGLELHQFGIACINVCM
jgi:hypothetical protein